VVLHGEAAEPFRAARAGEGRLARLRSNL
jgi:hypothetical protein